jgi:hypothetical protein
MIDGHNEAHQAASDAPPAPSDDLFDKVFGA